MMKSTCLQKIDTRNPWKVEVWWIECKTTHCESSKKPGVLQSCQIVCLKWVLWNLRWTNEFKGGSVEWPESHLKGTETSSFESSLWWHHKCVSSLVVSNIAATSFLKMNILSTVVESMSAGELNRECLVSEVSCCFSCFICQTSSWWFCVVFFYMPWSCSLLIHSSKTQVPYNTTWPVRLGGSFGPPSLKQT